MSQHGTDRTINGIVGLAEGLSTKLPFARTILLLDVPDGYGRDRSYDKIRGTDGGSPVESAVIGRDTNDDEKPRRAVMMLKGLSDELDAVVKTLRNLHADCDRIIGTKVEVPRCTSTGREGAIDWHDADCWDAPMVGPLCAKHYHKERRWRIAHGKPTREEAV